MENTPQHSFDLIEMFMTAGLVGKTVLILLLVLSAYSWAITYVKWRQFKQARRESEEFSALFWETRDLKRLDDTTKRLGGSPLAQVFSGGFRELSHSLQTEHAQSGAEPSVLLGTVERALRRSEYYEALKLEKGLTFLANTANAAPFIGLFGTVWGIMGAFHGLGDAKSSTIQAVAPGISEALIATAIGLAAAIPASVAYNYFASGVRQFRESMFKFSDEFLSLARLYLVNGKE